MAFQPERCPLASSVFHSSLLTTKSVNLAVGHDSFLCIMESLIIHIFIEATLITEVLLEWFSIHTAVYNELNLAENEV